MYKRFVSLGLCVLASGCAMRAGAVGAVPSASRTQFLAAEGGLAADIRKLEEERERQQLLVESLRLRIERQKLEAELRRAEAAKAKCQADARAILYEASEVATQCTDSRSQYRACLAETNQEAAESMTVGCVLGTLASFVLGPVAFLGCPVGAALAPDDSRCGAEPICNQTAEEALPEVLQDHGLSELPTCGDQLAGNES